MIFVLDACALISFLNDEPGADIVGDLLDKAADGEIEVCMNIVNLIEVHYGNIRGIGQERATFILEHIFASPIQVVSVFSYKIFRESSRMKAAHKCSIADAIGLATAMELSAQFVTSDHHELEAVEKAEPVPFVWLPARPKK